MGDVLKIRDEYRQIQWAVVIQECKASGLTNKKYCIQHGLSEKNSCTWESRPPMKNWRLLCPGLPTSKRIVRFQTPMLIQIHILSNSRPWVWGCCFLGGERGIIERLRFVSSRFCPPNIERPSFPYSHGVQSILSLPFPSLPSQKEKATGR